MTLENILKLLDAGYTKEEINALTATPKQEEPAPAPKAEPEPEKAKNAESVCSQTTTAGGMSSPRYLTADDLVKVIQAMNIQNAQRDEKPIETAEDIIASVIMPGKKG